MEQLSIQLREKDGRLQQREEELQRKDTQLRQKEGELQLRNADISRLQREVQRLQVGNIDIMHATCIIYYLLFLLMSSLTGAITADVNSKYFCRC